MRVINLIVVHCSATKADRDFTEQDLEVCHRRRGPGYHFYIRKNGDIKTTRPIEKIGAHARGYNAQSIGICYEGGISERGRPEDTRTVWQKHSLRVLVRTLLVDYPGCKVCGHRDLSPDLNGNGEIEPEELVLCYYVITFEITFYLHFQCHIHSRNRIFYRIRNTCHTCRIHSNIRTSFSSCPVR